jgi:hypothetical protein
MTVSAKTTIKIKDFKVTSLFILLPALLTFYQSINNKSSLLQRTRQLQDFIK